MGLKRTCYAVALLCASVPASAGFTLDFEGIGNNAAINGFYNGGTDSVGNRGFNHGVQFGTNTLGLIDADIAGPTGGNFANEPSPNTAMFFLSGPSAVLNYSPGFTGGFSFFYSSRSDATVNVYDGLNASGNVVGTLTLQNQASGNSCQGDPNGQFCNWTLASVSFSSLAKSIDFGGTINQIAYDNMKFGIDGSTTPPGNGGPTTPPVIPPIGGPIIPPINGGPIAPIPEPGTYALMATGLLMVGVAARRRRRA